MDLKLWLIYLVTDFILNITPGPAVILVSFQGVKYGFRKSCYGVLGLITGEALFFLLSALGLGAVILSVPYLFDIIRILGAIYLFYMGVRMIYVSFLHSADSNLIDIQTTKGRRLFFDGFVTMISNPKAIIFFVALLPQFMNPGSTVLLQFVILGLTTLISDFVILFAYGWISDKGRNLMRQNSFFFKIIERLSGLVLIGIGLNLLFMMKK